MYETRLACIVLLWPSIENAIDFEESNISISVSLLDVPMNTAVFDPCRSAGFKPASMIASIDLSKANRVNMSMTSVSFGCTLKNVPSKRSMSFIFPVPEATPSSSAETRGRVNLDMSAAPVS